MKFISLCSGIEAATVAWRPLGWEPLWLAEIDPRANAVLEHHYPGVPNLGDITKIDGRPYRGAADLVVGGTPCQSFSVAGLRQGLDDDRGNLAFEFLRIVGEVRPRWVLWENVPGVLSLDGGRAFGSILGALAELGYGFAYRVCDAQWFRVASHPRAVPQRRRRVFVVGYLGDWRPPAAVCLEREGLSWHPAPRREAGEKAADTLSARASAGGGLGTDFECTGGVVAEVAPTVNAHYGTKQGLENQHIDGGAGLFVAHTLTGEGHDASEDGTGRGTPLVFDTTQVTSKANYSNPKPGDHSKLHILETVVRRITPREAERLFGLPDDYTLVTYRGKPMADGPRYRLLGNSIAVNVLNWLGQRIAMCDEILR